MTDCSGPSSLATCSGSGRAGVEKGNDLSWIRLFILTVSVAPLVYCTSPDHKIEDATRIIHSWEATVRETITAFDRRAVPRLYARQVLQAAVETREQQAKQPEWNTIPADARRGLADAIDQLTSAVGESSGGQSRE